MLWGLERGMVGSGRDMHAAQVSCWSLWHRVSSLVCALCFCRTYTDCNLSFSFLFSLCLFYLSFVSCSCCSFFGVFASASSVHTARTQPLSCPALLAPHTANTPAFFVSDDELSNMTTPGSASSTFDLRRGLDDLRLAQSGGDDDRRRSSSVTSLFGSGPARARAATVSMTEERRSHYGQQQQQHFFGPGYELRRTTLRPNGNGNSSGSFTACTTGAGSAMYGHPRYAASSATEACLSAAASMSASAPPSPTATQSSTSSGESGISLGDSGSSMNLSHAALSGVCGATACGTGGDALSTVSVSTAGAIASRGHSPHALSDSRPAPSQHTNREHPLVMPHPTNAARLSTGSFICAEDMAKVRAAAAYHSPPHRPRKQRDGDLAKCLFDKPDPQSPSQVGAGDGKGEQESELPQVNGFFDSEAYGEKDTFATPPPSEARRPRARVRQSAIGHLAQGGGVTLRRSRSSPISSSFSPAAAHSAAGTRRRGVEGERWGVAVKCTGRSSEREGYWLVRWCLFSAEGFVSSLQRCRTPR